MALEKLKQAYPDLPPESIKIVDASKDPLGYSGTKVNVPTKSGMTAEVQINSPEMIYATEKPADAKAMLGEQKWNELASRPSMPEGGKGHAFYEDWRVLDRSDPKADAIAAESRAYYDAVRGAAGGGG